MSIEDRLASLKPIHSYEKFAKGVEDLLDDITNPLPLVEDEVSVDFIFDQILTRALQSNPPLINAQWRHVLKLLNGFCEKYFSFYPPERCYALFCEALLKSKNTSLAKHYLQQCPEAEDIAMSVATRFVLASVDGKDPLMAHAMEILSLITTPSKDLVEFLDFIMAIIWMGQYIEIQPKEVYETEDRKLYIKQLLNQCPEKYNEISRILELANMLGCGTTPSNLNAIKLLIAETSFHQGDIPHCTVLLNSLIRQKYIESWELASEVAFCDRYDNMEHRISYITFALIHCPDDLLQGYLECKKDLELKKSKMSIKSNELNVKKNQKDTLNQEMSTLLNEKLHSDPIVPRDDTLLLKSFVWTEDPYQIPSLFALLSSMTLTEVKSYFDILLEKSKDKEGTLKTIIYYYAMHIQLYWNKDDDLFEKKPKQVFEWFLKENAILKEEMTRRRDEKEGLSDDDQERVSFNGDDTTSLYTTSDLDEHILSLLNQAENYLNLWIQLSLSEGLNKEEENPWIEEGVKTMERYYMQKIQKEISKVNRKKNVGNINYSISPQTTLSPSISFDSNASIESSSSSDSWRTDYIMEHLSAGVTNEALVELMWLWTREKYNEKGIYSKCWIEWMKKMIHNNAIDQVISMAPRMKEGILVTEDLLEWLKEVGESDYIASIQLGLSFKEMKSVIVDTVDRMKDRENQKEGDLKYPVDYHPEMLARCSDYISYFVQMKIYTKIIQWILFVVFNQDIGEAIENIEWEEENKEEIANMEDDIESMENKDVSSRITSTLESMQEAYEIAKEKYQNMTSLDKILSSLILHKEWVEAGHILMKGFGIEDPAMYHMNMYWLTLHQYLNEERKEENREAIKKLESVIT